MINLTQPRRRERRLERIRNKPVIALAPREIGMLTPQEQRWIWDYLQWLRQAEQSTNA